jgi:Flp pilus assembly protein TadD
MASRVLDGLRALVQRPRLGLLTLILLGLLGYLGWLGVCVLWARWDRAGAEKALAEYDFAEARRRLDRAIRARPQGPELRLLAAQTARRDGDLESAEDHLRVYRELVGESSAQEKLERALLRAQRGKVHEKTTKNYLFEALDVHHPQSEQILEALATGCVQSYQLHLAQFWATELLKKWPNNAIGRLLRAQTIDTQGNRDKATALLQELVRDYPKYFRARLSLADVLFKSRRYRDALVEYAALHQQRPGEMMPLLGLASSYARLGEERYRDEARPLMQQLEERYPEQSEALLECGRFALEEKRLADAERLLRRALELAPNDHEVHRELGICLGRLGKHEESRKHLNRAKEIEADLILLEKTLAAMSKAPNDPGPRRQAGEICLRNGQVAEGLRWLYGILDVAPNDKPTHQVLADFFAVQGDTERADLHRRQAR